MHAGEVFLFQQSLVHGGCHVDDYVESTNPKTGEVKPAISGKLFSVIEMEGLQHHQPHIVAAMPAQYVELLGSILPQLKEELF